MIALRQALDGAKYVRFESEHICYAWHGGHGIHCYDITPGNRVNAREINFWNIGDFSKDSITFEEAKADIDARVDGD